MVNKQNMQINLEPRNISASTNLPHELEFMGDALQHQVDVFEQSRDANIILDLAPTGTGKTKAGFTVLLHQPTSSAIYIAPTNALVQQQTEAALKFVKEAGLPHVVKSASAKDIKGWSNDKVGKRSGEKLYNVLRNPSTIFPEVGANKPILLVTNPDIFYYATFFTYNRLDKDNIASSFYTQFATVIIDEFHLHDAKKLVGLLFYIAYFHVFGFFKNQRRVVLLTATPEPACEAALESLGKQGVKIVRVDGENQNSSNLLPSQTAVNLELRPIPEKKDDFLLSIASQVVELIEEKPNHNGAVILDSKDQINRLADILKNRGLDGKFGRITGSTPQLERQSAAQKQIILATSTVDVGFNFEKTPAPTRQNLDWLIFSARERASFWQRLGRVGRVLGKVETDIPSLAIAYLPDEAWKQGLENLDTTGGRNALKTTLESLRCLDKPFLRVYWCSEAFLEIARPLLELEVKLEGLNGSDYIPLLFNTMRETLGGKRTWDNYRWRMKILQGAENLSNTSVKNIKKDWKYVKGGQALLKAFIKVHYPEDWENIETKRTTLAEYEAVLFEDEEVAEDLFEFAEIWRASYSPLFQFRDSLFDNLNIYDPHGLLLDELDETILDPIHLLRYYEFRQKDELIQVTARAAEIYEISFRLRYHGVVQDFINTQLNKLTAFRDCHIIRRLNGAVSPTPLLTELEKNLLPGVIVCPRTNASIVFQLYKLGVISYPIQVECDDFSREYIILPSLSGILTLAMRFKQLQLPDNECFVACL